MMERLQYNLDFQNNRFVFLYGFGVQDIFISQDYREINIDEAIWQTLKSEGYNCILFCSYTDRIFFLDQPSYQHARAPVGSEIQDIKTNFPRNEMRFFSNGPLGRELIFNSLQQPQPNTIIAPSQIGDINALELMDSLMRETRVRTAVVILQAETFLRHFEGQGVLAGRIGSWNGLPSTNRNLCVLLFANDNLPQTIRENPSFLQVPELTTYINNSIRNKENNSLCEIPGADIQELSRLVDYIRIKDKKKINWLERERLVEVMFADGKMVRSWLAILHKLPFIDMENTRKYLSSSLRIDGKSWRDELSKFIGLSHVKQRVLELEAFLLDRRQRYQAGMISQFNQPPALHLAFLGNPGTGKTTVARLIGEMYRDLGLLQRGHLVEAQVSDLISNHVGETALKTEMLVQQALGGVLFVDEAYQLSDNLRGGFGQEAIDTLLSSMENERSRLAVIFAGYTQPMLKFMESNPGLPSRIPEVNRIPFPDYQPEELSEILLGFIHEKGLKPSDEFLASSKEMISNLYNERDDKFGNARKMREIAEAIAVTHALRRQKGKLSLAETLKIVDISEGYQRYLSPPVPEMSMLMSELDELIGLEDVKTFIRDLVYRLQADHQRRRKGRNISQPILNMVFSGNPGTGKTTVARLLGRIFRALGILRKGHVLEVKSEDLIGQYVGQTAPRTTERIKEALDGVLFIDEAYLLTPYSSSGADYAREALGTLLKGMDNYSGRIVVVAAGYPQEMANFLKANPGLSRRFTKTVVFKDYTSQDLIEMLRRKSAKAQIVLPLETQAKAISYIENVRQRKRNYFGNAGEIDILFQEMQTLQSRRMVLTGNSDALDNFEPADIPGNQNTGMVRSAKRKQFNLVANLPKENGISLNLDHARRAVALLTIMSKGHKIGSGTGFLITPQGLMLTAYHVVAEAEDIQVHLDLDVQNIVSADLVGFDENSDIAVLRIPAISGLDYPWLPLAEQDYCPSMGDNVVVLSYPLGDQLGKEITFTEGVVSSLRSEGEVIQISATVTHGSSGGPVFRRKDLKVIGCIHGGVKQDVASGLNFAINIQLVRQVFADEDSLASERSNSNEVNRQPLD